MVVFLYIILSLYFREGIDHLRFSTICEVTPPPKKKKKKCFVGFDHTSKYIDISITKVITITIRNLTSPTLDPYYGLWVTDLGMTSVYKVLCKVP